MLPPGLASFPVVLTWISPAAQTPAENNISPIITELRFKNNMGKKGKVILTTESIHHPAPPRNAIQRKLITLLRQLGKE